MEQNLTKTNLLNENEQIKREESWLMAQAVDENQQQQTQNTPVFYKFDDNMGKF